ncbi:MAG: glutamate formimidoyltransferase [Myxococcales bacterium]|nr:MAG: glutamate formimidoyltransferase [Myxococcales bacterium]
MRQIVECVPNFSEGRRRDVIDAIAAAVRATPGARLLDVDPNGDYNRTVYTFVGDAETVVQAAFAATEAAARLIDMAAHVGGHPRIGAADVVPFIPISGATMEDCVACAKRYGARIARDLGIPAYLYEYAATRPERRNLAMVRHGQYEGLPHKLADPAWRPDFGEPVFNAKSGATVTGARKFLIAYNVNLRSRDVAAAEKVAGVVRESGRVQRDAKGAKIVGPAGRPLRLPGRLKTVKGLGVDLPDAGFAQVSMNLVDFETTPLHAAYEACREEAEKLGQVVTGSEIVGLVPKAALLMTGRFYAGGQAETISEAELVALAVKKLRLDDFMPFDPAKKVIEYLIGA